MAIRVVRHLGGRVVNEDHARLLAAIPYGAGEKVRHIRMDAFIATQEESPADQPSEVNWVVLDVPWAILLTKNAKLGTGGTGNLDSFGEWDTMYRQLILEYGTDGSEFYGGDIDLGDTIQAPSETDDEPLISRGPIGIQRLFSREVLMRPLLAEGANDVRYYDDFNVAVSPEVHRESGGAMLFGCVRYGVAADNNLGIEFVTDTAPGLSALIGGDIQRVQYLLAHDTGNQGDRLRTIMFGGDNFVEANTVQALQAKAAMKIWCSIETPYELGVR